MTLLKFYYAEVLGYTTKGKPDLPFVMDFMEPSMGFKPTTFRLRIEFDL